MKTRLLALLGALAALTALSIAPALAHPLGNFTTNTATAVVVGPDHLYVHYALDLAEIPALQAKQGFSKSGADGFRVNQCATMARSLDVRVAAKTIPLRVVDSSIAFLPGQGGLQTLRLDCRYSATAAVGKQTTVAVRDQNFADRIGWRELSVVGDGVHLAHTALPTVSPTKLLRSYPSGAISSPLHVTSGSVLATLGGPRLTIDPTTGSAAPATGANRSGATETERPRVRKGDRLTRAFTSLVSHRHLSIGFALGAVLLATLLGAFHALAPGHGKTLMAAYIVGRRGGKREVLAIGSTVALAHTAGVVALGILITTSQAIAPERAMKWLSVASGCLLVLVGAAILWRRVRGRGLSAQLAGVGTFSAATAAYDGSALAGTSAAGDVSAMSGYNASAALGLSGGPFGVAAAPELPRFAKRFVKGPTLTTTHAHGGFTHSHVLPAPGNELRTGSLIAMGLAGGLVPSPSALVVLLGAITLGRVPFGLGLVAAYGVGMAATLMLAGILLVRAEARLRQWTDGSARIARMVRWFPVATAALLVAGGLSLVARSIGRA